MAAIEAHITGTVWKIEVSPGDTVDEGDTVVILESMKMEMPVEAEDAGVVKEISVEEGQAVSEGDTLWLSSNERRNSPRASWSSTGRPRRLRGSRSATRPSATRSTTRSSTGSRR